MKLLLPTVVYLISASCCPSFADSEVPPNFVVILTDDQSWVGTSLQIDPDDSDSQSDYYQTPSIERLATMGMRFTDGYAPAPFCCPTRRSLLIGQTPARHIYQKDQKTWPKKFREQLSIPRMLKAADPRYRTAHFGKWDHRFDGITPEQMGYDESDGSTGNATGGGKGSGGPAASDDPKLVHSINRSATDFMNRCGEKSLPFFLQVSHYAVHLDIFYSQRAYNDAIGRTPGKKHQMPEFAAMTNDVDRAIGDLLNHLQQKNLLRNTYVVFLSDNGGRLALPKAPDADLSLNHPLRDGKGSMYEGGIRVPFVVAGPGIAPGSISRVPVTGLDILPTVADFAGYKPRLPETLDGGSLRPLLTDNGTGTVDRSQPFLIFHQAVARKSQSAIREGNLKLVKIRRTRSVQLFDLSKDRSERNDLSKTFPEKRHELERKLETFLASIGAETEQTISKEALKKLFE